MVCSFTRPKFIPLRDESVLEIRHLQFLDANQSEGVRTVCVEVYRHPALGPGDPASEALTALSPFLSSRPNTSVWPQGRRMKPRWSYLQENPRAGDRLAA